MRHDEYIPSALALPSRHGQPDPAHLVLTHHTCEQSAGWRVLAKLGDPHANSPGIHQTVRVWGPGVQ